LDTPYSAAAYSAAETVRVERPGGFMSSKMMNYDGGPSVFKSPVAPGIKGCGSSQELGSVGQKAG